MIATQLSPPITFAPACVDSITAGSAVGMVYLGAGEAWRPDFRPRTRRMTNITGTATRNGTSTMLYQAELVSVPVLNVWATDRNQPINVKR